ncbi:MAG TPA: glycosyltransferase [Pyrinomonadaceae bacterium]|nr:glycosyltransferase [Pyrinomonadaceae bacterium]
MKQRILQLVDSFNEGGSERQALELTRLLRDCGRYDVFLATLNHEGPLKGEAQSLMADIPTYQLTSFCNRNAALQLRRFVAYLRKNEIDLIQSHDFYTNIFGMTAGFFAGVPVRIASRRETNCMRSRAQLILQRIAYGLAQQVVANSDAVRVKLVAERVSKKRITVIHNGIAPSRVDASTSRNESLKQLALEAARGFRSLVTIVANMRHEVKDYPMFLRAAQLVKLSVPGTAFLIAGEGQLRPSIEALTEELGLRESVFFLGRCEKVSHLLNASDVCVLSSRAEGFSNSILEYMAAGCPVVATNVGGAAEAIVEGETGYLVDSGDYISMAKRLVGLIRNPDKAQAMGESGKLRVEQNFSLSSLLYKTEELYQTLLNASGRRSETVLTAADAIGPEALNRSTTQ